MITLITPTGDRPEAFKLCERWISQQSYNGPLQWIVVDDGKNPIQTNFCQDYIRRVPTANDPNHTLGINILEAIHRIDGNKILIIEDDDYYSPKYLETMSKWLDEADLVGEVGAKYYWLNQDYYYFWDDHKHASFCRTGFTSSAIPKLKETIKTMKNGDWRIDLEFWKRWKGSKKLVKANKNGPSICVGIKGMPGRSGVTHKVYPRAKKDVNRKKLYEWIGKDAEKYEKIEEKKQAVIYSSNIGSYDNIVPHKHKHSRYLFSNQEACVNGWNLIKVNTEGYNNRRASRLYKILSHKFFSDDVVLYVDACIDFKIPPEDLIKYMMKESVGASLVVFKHNQHKTLKQERNAIVKFGYDSASICDKTIKGYENLEVFWGGVILRKRGSEKFNEKWWDLYQKGSCRDQLTLPIAIKETNTSCKILNEPLPYFNVKSDLFFRKAHNKF